MKFSEFMLQEFGAELDALFAELDLGGKRTDYQQCVFECRHDYNDCMYHAHTPEEREACRAGLGDCFKACADASGKELPSGKEFLEKLESIEDKALAAWRAKGNT